MIERNRTGLRTAALLAGAAVLALAACGEEQPQTVSEAADALEEQADALGESADELADMAEAAADEAEEAIMDAQEAAATAAMRTPSPDGARVYFANLEDGAVVSSPLTIEFGAENIGVTQAGDQTEGTGHHHILIDTTVDALDTSMPIPADDTHVHFGMGQTETTLELAPGEHTLQLVMGDWTHIPHDPVVASEVITVTVE